ncbi:hypothetical protein ACEWY4_018309 [Coilia grayii]|uniref:Uncharacterized protein n=1 Tax=Coilia grayii TaxID=363190 RepID=A0ABD1JKQ3_9TELE
MAGRGYGWDAPPPLPSYENTWNGEDQPPSYEEALMGAGTQQFQFPTASAAVYSDTSISPAYPPLPSYQPPRVSLAWSQSTVAQAAPRVMSNDELMAWWRTVEPWEHMLHSPDIEPRELARDVQRVQNALQLYGFLVRTHSETLQKHIAEMHRTSNDISKASDVRKVAGVTGGTTRAVGGAVAVTGIVLAPFTMGASLAITALGVGVATAGGITKASLKNKVAVHQNRRALESIVRDYRNKLEDIEACLRFIYTGMKHIRQNKLSISTDANMGTGRVSGMLELSGVVAQGMVAAGRSLDLLRGFAGGIGTFYSKKDSQMLKKGKEGKFGKTLRKVAQRLQNTLVDLRGIADSLSRF